MTHGHNKDKKIKVLSKLTEKQQAMLNSTFDMNWYGVPPNPPGLAGEITDFIRGQSCCPIQVMAIASTMGLMAGICGRAFNISDSSLNQYFILLAEPEMGKTVTLNGIDLITCVMVLQLGMADFAKFLGPEWFTPNTSIHDCLDHYGPCFVSVSEHIESSFRQICKPTPDRKQRDLNRMITSLYKYSGQQSKIMEEIYGKKYNSSVEGPALSILGTGDPDIFYPAIKHMDKDLASCITMIEYDGPYIIGDRISNNLPLDLAKSISKLAQISLEHGVYNHNPIDVGYTPDAKHLFDTFNIYSTEKANSESPASHIYGRGHLRALRAAATIACGMPWVNGAPVIDMETARWAISFIQHGTVLMENRMSAS